VPPTDDRAATAHQTSPLDVAFDLASDLAASARAFLGSERGRHIRRNMATAVIVGAPLISELPFVRRTKVARLLQTAAIGTLLIRGAEWLRDWEPNAPPAPVP
jgi:hypothetical protein